MRGEADGRRGAGGEASCGRRGGLRAARRVAGGVTGEARGTVSLTRRVIFAAAHRYRRPEWDDAKNETVFGACARPAFHGHTYVCDVTVSGPVDERTGMLVDLRVLDAVLRSEVVDRFDHRNLTLDVPEFADGMQIPTGENLARLIATLVQRVLGARASVTQVTVAEDPTLRAMWRADGS